MCVFVLGTDKQKLWSFHVIVKSHKQSANRLKSHSKNSRFIIISRANMLHNNSCWNNFTAAIFNSNNSQYYFNNYHDRHFEILSLISQLVSTVHSFEKSVRPCSQYKWLDGSPSIFPELNKDLVVVSCLTSASVWCMCL